MSLIDIMLHIVHLLNSGLEMNSFDEVIISKVMIHITLFIHTVNTVCNIGTCRSWTFSLYR